MLSKSKKELVFGIIVLAAGLIYLAMTVQLPRSGTIDSATVPYIIALVITVLGVLQIISAVRLSRTDPASNDRQAVAGADRPDYRTVAKTAGLIALYVIFLDMFGFPLMSALYLFVQFVVLTPNYLRKNYPVYAIIAVVTSLFVYYLFLYAFDMMLPDGNFWWDIGLFQ